MYEVSDLRATIVPKSDQLNSEQLLGGPITVTVTEVRIGNSDEQPVAIHYIDDGGRPYKPSKTQRKVLLLAWGHDGRAWTGRSMTLYCDPKIKFGGEEVGGIRISHLSDIEREIHVSLTATKGKKAPHVIKRLESKAPVEKIAKPARTERHGSMVADFELLVAEQGLDAFVASWQKLPKEDRAAIGIAERDRIAALAKPADAAT